MAINMSAAVESSIKTDQQDQSKKNFGKLL